MRIGPKLAATTITMITRIFVTFCFALSFFNGATAQEPQPLTYEEIKNVLDSANLYVDNLQHERGADWIELAEIYITDDSPKEIRATHYLIKAKWLLNTWQLRDAETEFLKSIALWYSLDDSLNMAFGYSGLGTTVCEQNRYQEAIRYQLRAIDYYGARDSSQHYGLVSNLAVSYDHAQDYTKSLKHYLKVREYFSRNNLPAKQAVVESNIGEVFRSGLDDIPRAIEHYHKAIQLNKQTNQPNFLVQNYHNIGLAYLETEQFDSAYYYIKESVKMRNEQESKGGLAISMHALGKYFLDTRQPDSALTAFGKTLQISEELGIAPGVFYGSLGMGEVYESEGYYAQAQEAFKKASSTADEIGSLELQEKARMLLYNLSKTQNRPTEALKYHEQLVTIRDSVRSMQNREELTEIKIKYETELARAENAALKSSQETQQMQLERQQWLVFGLSGMLLLVIVGSLVLIQAHRQRKVAYLKAIDARKELEVQYAKMIEQEAKLNETIALKNRIFSVLGHDLRSPLANISSMLPLISEKDVTHDELTIILAHLQRDTDLSLNTLHNILQWSQIQSNEIDIHRDQLLVKEAFNDLRQVFESSARLKKVNLDFIDYSDGKIWVDENQFRSIATNLVSNAIKFSPTGETVVIKVEDNLAFTEFSVSDKGRGFHPDILSQISQRKSRHSAEGTLGEKGTGIGLQLVRDFVDAHDGAFRISRNEYGGAIVTVSFPKNDGEEEVTEHLQSA